MIFFRELLLDLGISLHAASIIRSDSKSAVDMSLDPVSFKKTKHILRAAEFLRDLVAREVVSLAHVKGSVMIADILTKAVSRAVYVELMNLLDNYATSGEVCPGASAMSHTGPGGAVTGSTKGSKSVTPS